MIYTRDNYPEKVDEDIQRTIEEEFLKLFGPDNSLLLLEDKFQPLVFGEAMTKTWQADDCEDMKEKDYSDRIPTNWAVPMFSKSRIRVIPSQKRVNGPHEGWEYVPLNPPVESPKKEKSSRFDTLPNDALKPSNKSAETKTVEPKLPGKEEIKVPENEAIQPKLTSPEKDIKTKPELKLPEQEVGVQIPAKKESGISDENRKTI